MHVDFTETKPKCKEPKIHLLLRGNYDFWCQGCLCTIHVHVKDNKHTGHKTSWIPFVSSVEHHEFLRFRLSNNESKKKKHTQTHAIHKHLDLESCRLQSWQYTTRGKGKSLLKLYGTNKLGEFCTAYIKVQEPSGKVYVIHCSTHHGHDTQQLAHLYIPEDMSMKLVSKTTAGGKNWKTLWMILEIMSKMNETIYWHDRTF